MIKEYEYVFWLRLIKKGVLIWDPIWNIPKQLIKIVITNGQIRLCNSDGIYSQDVLAIDLSSVVQITWSITSPGSKGYVKIITQGLESYCIVPVNPLEPTLLLVPDNTDELIAFCTIVEFLKNNHLPDFDENPYIRQFQKKARPSYLKDKQDIVFWNKNISPLEYYEKFVPESKAKEIRLVAQINKIITLGAIIVSAVGIVYMLCLLNG